jgi:hypothetical protein
MLKPTSRSKDLAVERLTWTLLAALSGVTVGMTACSGRSERTEDASGAGDSGSSGRGGSSGYGGTSSKSVGGTGNVPATGGTTTATGGTTSGGATSGGATSGGATSGGAESGGTNAAGESSAGSSSEGGAENAGSGGTGTGGSSPRCEGGRAYGELELCEGSFVHRPQVTSCAVPERLGPSDGGAGGTPGTAGTGGTDSGPTHQCDTDLDCVAYPHGFCLLTVADPAPPVRACTYACTSDSDCNQGAICACSDEFERDDGTTVALGICRPATCASDADCGEGALCISPVDAFCGPLRPSAFHCQSPGDACAGPADCGISNYCTHDGSNFQCIQRPACGRPFVVQGAARVAGFAAAGDWAEGSLGAFPSELSVELRAEVARYFAEAGLMEHASIAAFARFSLQLLALGAPAELVAEAARAMQDETRHARLCFGLAARYGNDDVGPGPLELSGALDQVDLLAVTELVFTEGCIGETSAALEAAWAADAAEAPELRAVLAGIAEDELRHAALAFRFVAWAAGRDARVKPLLARRLREAQLASVDVAPPVDRSRAVALARHGVLDTSTRSEARRRALEDIVSRATLSLAEAPQPIAAQVSV